MPLYQKRVDRLLVDSRLTKNELLTKLTILIRSNNSYEIATRRHAFLNTIRNIKNPGYSHDDIHNAIQTMFGIQEFTACLFHRLSLWDGLALYYAISDLRFSLMPENKPKLEILGYLCYPRSVNDIGYIEWKKMHEMCIDSITTKKSEIKLVPYPILDYEILKQIYVIISQSETPPFQMDGIVLNMKDFKIYKIYTQYLMLLGLHKRADIIMNTIKLCMKPMKTENIFYFL